LAYQYKGSIRDAERPNLQPCGTYAGYERHKYHNEPACDECSAAMAAYFRTRRERDRQPAKPSQFTDEKCGTWPGRRRHDYYNTPPCEPCMAAARAYQQERRAAKRAKN